MCTIYISFRLYSHGLCKSVVAIEPVAIKVTNVLEVEKHGALFVHPGELRSLRKSVSLLWPTIEKRGETWCIIEGRMRSVLSRIMGFFFFFFKRNHTIPFDSSPFLRP